MPIDRMMKSKMLIFLLLMAVGIEAQTHNSVSVEEEELYKFLEMAEISGAIAPLPTTRPLPRSHIKRALRQMGRAGNRLSASQKSVLADYVERFADDADQSILSDGDLRLKHDIFPMSWRFFPQVEGSIDLADTSQSGLHSSLTGIFKGDMGKNVSYGFELNSQLNKINMDDNAPYPYAWAPYTYTKVWDASVHYLSNISPQYLMPRELSTAWAFTPEIDLSLWQNRADFRFGRMRRDWGFGEGNLFLDEQARPFYGFEGALSPWKWLSLSFLLGSLEYGPTFRNNPFVFDQYPTTDSTGKQDYTVGAKEVARVQQNIYRLLLVEIKLGKWLYIGLYDTGIFLKRMELGYLFPFIPSLFLQETTGDYDNILFGATIALSWPGVLRLYGTFLADELKPNTPALRNQTAYQAGVKATLPTGIWSLITLQYTKIEPFTYTHYITDNTPWYYGLEMETGYQNHGENIGSYLEPNSDELLFSLHVQPSRSWTAHFTYRMIRHGGSDVKGSTFDSWGESSINGDGADADPNGAYYPGGTKDFLKDGTYEWFHIFSLGASLDFRHLFAPMKFSIQYSFVYEYDSDYSSNNSFTAIEGSEIFRHLLTLKVNLWAK